MGAIIKDNESIPIIINGMPNHVHILCILSKNISLSKLIEEIKRHSSRWIKTKGVYYRSFAWQEGFGGFSVNYSDHETIKKYIENQEKHHRTINYKVELEGLLKENDVVFIEKYLWDD